MVVPRVTRKKKEKLQKKVQKSKKCSRKFAKKEKYKKGGLPPQKYSISIFYKISSGARKEPAEAIPPSINKRNRNKIKATGEK